MGRMLMIRRRVMVTILLAAILLGAIPVTSMAAPDPYPTAQGTNVLKNPGFEGITCAPDSASGWCEDNWTRDTYDGSTREEIFTPQGWVTWWRKGGDYGRPEVKVIPRVAPFIGPPARINNGQYAVQYFNFFRLQDGGLYQKVDGLTPGATVQLTAYGHGWACDNDDRPYSCGDPWTQTFQVGIEPNGGTDPFSPSIVWSAEQTAPDAYRAIGTATAQVGGAGTVTVFLRAKAKWPVKHLDAYWDDASLVVTSEEPQAQPTAAPDQPAQPAPTARPQPTPRPDGSLVHVVEPGDTLFGIALAYNTTVDELRRLNAGSIGDNNMIVVGQEIVVSAPTQPAAAEPTAVPEVPTPIPPQDAVTPEPGGETEAGNSICVVAYHDRDGNTFRAADTEEMLPNAEFLLADASGVLNRYVSDGIHEPYCFTGLAPGTYRVIQNSPSGYMPSGPAEWPAALSEGSRLELQFGNARSDDVGEPATGGEEAGEPAPSEEPETPAESGSVSTIFSTIAKVSGILVLVLAAGVAALFIFTRRRY
jgi:LysM repeat protein